MRMGSSTRNSQSGETANRFMASGSGSAAEDCRTGEGTMSTLIDVLAKIEEYQKAATEMPSAPVVDLWTALDPNSSEALDPIDFGKLVDFACDQSARWVVRWHFSPATSPD